MLCFTRPRYQVSVYRTIGPLVSFCDDCARCGYFKLPLLTAKYSLFKKNGLFSGKLHIY